MNVKLYVSSSDTPGSGLNNACPDCLAPALQPRNCETHGNLESVKRVYRDGDTVLEITDEDIENMKLETFKNFVTVAMLRDSEVSDLLTESYKKYHLVNDGYSSGLTYAALLDAMLRGNKVLMGKYSLQNGRETLAAIVPDGDGLVLLHLPFSDIRRPKPTLELPDVTTVVRKGMKVITDSIPSSFDYDSMVDSYDLALQKVVLEKSVQKIIKNADQFLPMTKNKSKGLVKAS